MSDERVDSEMAGHNDSEEMPSGDKPHQTVGGPEVGGGLSGPNDPDLTRQEIINGIVEERAGGDLPDDVKAVLEQRFAAAGLPPMPEPWLRAVAETAAQGNAYVVSRGTLGEVGAPDPSTRDETYGRS